jgi:hypothetical protein
VVGFSFVVVVSLPWKQNQCKIPIALRHKINSIVKMPINYVRKKGEGWEDGEEGEEGYTMAERLE